MREVNLIYCIPDARATQDMTDDFIQFQSILDLVNDCIACKVMASTCSSNTFFDLEARVMSVIVNRISIVCNAFHMTCGDYGLPLP